MDLAKKYQELHAEYIQLEGIKFDEFDIDQSAISYACNTCAVEGNTISLGETETVIISDKVIAGHSLREHLEIKDAYEAFIKMHDFIKGGYEMNEALAMTFHKLNTKSWMKEEATGQYKTITNRVGGRSTPYPEKAKELFKNLMNSIGKEEDVFVRASKLHLHTVLIHPWQDGNGRTARLMMNYELIKNGHGHIQISKNQKDDYFKAIRDSIHQEKLTPFLNFTLALAIKTYQQKNDYLKKKRETNANQEVWDFNHSVEIY